MALPVLVYGTLVVDRVRRLARMPLPGEYAEYHDEEWFLGGEAANTAAALRHWGEDVALIANSAGDSTESLWLLDRLRLFGLSTQYLDPRPGPAPTCDLYVDEAGERTLFGRSWDRVDAPWPSVEKWQWFTADPNHKALARAAVRRAAEQGARIYTLDFCEPDEWLPAGSIWQSSTDWVGTPGDEAANHGAVRELAAKHQSLAILTDGARGIYVGWGSGSAWLPPYPCPRVVDATGAGDVFRAGMLWRLNQGDRIGDALAFASAAGCLNCITAGATAGLPTLQEVSRHLASNAEITASYCKLNDAGIQEVAAEHKPSAS